MGTKELKNRLSHYLRKVRAGEVVQVTSRGRVIAELRLVEEQSDGDGDIDCLRALEAEGLATVGDRRFRDFAPVKTRGTLRASQIIIDERV